MSAEETNIIGIVETQFTVTARRMLQTHNGSFDLCNWVFSCLEQNKHKDDIKDLVALLINEHHALQKQLNRRHYNA